MLGLVKDMLLGGEHLRLPLLEGTCFQGKLVEHLSHLEEQRN